MIQSSVAWHTFVVCLVLYIVEEQLVDFISLPHDIFGNVNIREIWFRAFVINTEQKMYFEPADEVCEVVYTSRCNRP